MTMLVYDFSEGGRQMKDLLGGKGANLWLVGQDGPATRRHVPDVLLQHRDGGYRRLHAVARRAGTPPLTRGAAPGPSARRRPPTPSDNQHLRRALR